MASQKTSRLSILNRGVNLLRPVLSFLCLGLVLQIALYTLFMIADLIWVDFLHHNPNRPQSNALEMMALSPLYGLLQTLAWSLLWLVAAALLAIAAQLIWRRVPYRFLLIMLPVCGYFLFLQKHFLFPSDDPILFGGPSGYDYSWPFFLENALDQSIILAICCWWNNRSSENHVAPAAASST